MSGNPATDGDRPTDDPETRRRDELNLLLLDVGAGDRAAFATLYRRTSAKLLGVCLKMLRDRGEAEEVLQDVYVTVWRRAVTFDPTLASAITWLAAIARNRAIDRLRTRREEPLDETIGEEIVDDSPSPAAIAEYSEERRRLERCLEGLPAQHGSVVREAFFTGATYAELAERLSVPLGTLKSWIRRSLLQLKACLEQ
ncbi:RNA polymerase subunit sigma-24 [Paraburkholderia monticola]|uniref:RNA polymerase sigma factor n=1 Tax=Paraburkholderia monticola TaxID=1399968 RepID=A0A149PNC5_9BURK|nr:sigma-70 family RNA polymerase sigma factor [Paraburkholderia monticola]KXU86489.1 RNA polymerase subunit sigma-24 [Paraburkholderia monticola]